MSRYISPILNEGTILSCGDDLSGVPIKKTILNLFSKLLPLKATIDIPIIKFYIIET